MTRIAQFIILRQLLQTQNLNFSKQGALTIKNFKVGKSQ